MFNAQFTGIRFGNKLNIVKKSACFWHTQFTTHNSLLTIDLFNKHTTGRGL